MSYRFSWFDFAWEYGKTDTAEGARLGEPWYTYDVPDEEAAGVAAAEVALGWHELPPDAQRLVPGCVDLVVKAIRERTHYTVYWVTCALRIDPV